MVQRNVLEKIESDQLAVHVVWTPVLRSDDRASVDKARQIFPGERVTQYWDGDQSLGKTYGKVVKLPRERLLAWDIYFAFDRKSQWNEKAPKPTDWAHQLGRDKRTLKNGEALRQSLERLLEDRTKNDGE